MQWCYVLFWATTGGSRCRKGQAAATCGIRTRLINLPVDVTQQQVLAQLAALNSDAAVHGVLVQLPLSPQLDAPTTNNAVLH